MELFKILILGLLAAVVVSLATGLFHLVQGQNAAGEGAPDSAAPQGGSEAARVARASAEARAAEHSRKMARALTVRVALSVTLFIVILIGWYTGLLVPHGGGH